MSVTLKDIAVKAGVSVSIVSRILNNQAKKYRISPVTEARVLKAARELNYRPNQLARGLRMKKTHTIGLIVPDISNPFFAHIARVIQKQAYQEGYSLLVCNTDENINTEMEQIDIMRSRRLDGFIIMPVGVTHDHIDDLLANTIPLVLLDRCFDDCDTHSVVVDNYLGACQAVEHLTNLGHEQIAIIQGLPNTYTNNARVNGYKDILKKKHIAVDESLIVGNDFRKENGYTETKFLLKLQVPPTAIFTTSDLITLGALQAIYEENLKIPEDISIVAFDDIDFAPYLLTPLTAVEQPKELMGEVAVKLLIDDINDKGKTLKKRIVLKPKLVIRKSVHNRTGNRSLKSVK
jgi:LacI family transcriptional regulator